MEYWLRIFVFSIFLIALRANEQNKVHISPATKEFFVKVNDPFQIACFVLTTKSSTDAIKWDTPSTGEKYHVQTEAMTGDLEKRYSNITIQSIKEMHFGKYKCSFGSSEESFEIKKPTENKVQANYTYGDESATLSCSMEGVDQSRIKKVQWLKNDTLVTELAEEKRFIENTENHTLTITDTSRNDADLYIARFTLKDSETPYDCAVYYAAAPLVLDFDKSKNLIEEDTMELQCKVKGFPRAVVHWMKDDKEINSSRVILSPLNGYVNARLIIKSVEFEDAGEYTCKAYSEYFNTSDSKTLVVRVKDKLAALWPFLGIVGEVVILCTIIFIYEKRRNKQAESEDNNAEDVDSSSLKKDGVRHRGQKK